MAPQVGPDYQQLVLEGLGHSYIVPYDRVSDGHAAWLALIGHFEGFSYLNQNVEDAYSALECIHYMNVKGRDLISKFIEKHNEEFL